MIAHTESRKTPARIAYELRRTRAQEARDELRDALGIILIAFAGYALTFFTLGVFGGVS